MWRIYSHTPSCRKEVDDIVYEVDSSLIVVKPGADVDIGMTPEICLIALK